MHRPKFMILNVDFAYMSQMNSKNFVHNATFSVQLPYIAGTPFKGIGVSQV